MVRRLRRGLLAGTAARLRLVGIVLLALWAAVLWAWLTQSTVPSNEPPAPPPTPAMRLVVASGRPAPSGGAFDRFDVASQPVAAPVNASGEIAFYASIVRSSATEGIFLAKGTRIAKIAAVGDPVPGGGALSGFAKHPVPSLNDAGKVAFGAAVTGARAGEGVFLASEDNLTAVALSGTEAPGVPNGTFLEFDLPSLNNRDEIVFLATVRRGREVTPILYLWTFGKLRKLLAAGEKAPGGGTFEEFGVPAINNKGVVAFPAVIERGPVLGGIFLAGSVGLRLLVGAGETLPGGGMLVRFSERVALNDDDNLAFGAHLDSNARAEGVFIANPAGGRVQVAAVGEEAPGGGRFAGFGPWPTIGAGDAVAFMAAIDDGPGPLGLYVKWPEGLKRVAMIGDHLADGRLLATFTLNPVTSIGPNGGVTFATMGDSELGQGALYYYGPPPQER
jgi:hypothetical protein